jgi:hypothetical protein
VNYYNLPRLIPAKSHESRGFYQGLDPQKDRRGQDRRLRGDAAALRVEPRA